MNVLGAMRTRAGRTAALTMVAVMAITGMSYASSSSAASSSVTLCAKKGSGALTLSKNGACKKKTTPLVVNQSGVQGPAGGVGPQGPGAIGFNLTTTTSTSKTVTVPGGDTIAVTCNGTQFTSSIAYTSGDSTKIDQVAGGLLIANGTTSWSYDLGSVSYTDPSNFVSAGNTKSFTMTTKAPASTYNTKSSVHLTIGHGTRSSTLDVLVAVSGGYCNTTLQLTPTA